MDCHSISLFSNAQLSLIPPHIVKQICVALNINSSSADQVMFKLLKWGQMQIEYHKTNGQREPLLTMMETLRMQSSCSPCCLNPIEHFNRGICCPIGIFYDSIKDICPVAEQIFKKPEVQQEVIQAVNHLLSPRQACPIRHHSGHSTGSHSSNSDQHSISSNMSDLPMEHQSCRWICFLQKVKPIVLLFECIESTEFHSATTSVMLNLLNKLNHKFILCSVPQLIDSSKEKFNEWESFFFDQVESSADCMVILLTHSFLSFQERLGKAVMNETSFRLNEKRIFSVWSKFRQHSQKSGSPILLVAMSQEVHDRAKKLFPQVIRVPNETKRLIRAIKDSVS